MLCRWRILLASLLLAGCGTTAVPAPKASAEIDLPARVTNERTRRIRPLVAPPPAYGNRVVLEAPARLDPERPSDLAAQDNVRRTL
jgi:hypothetical protein